MPTVPISPPPPQTFSSLELLMTNQRLGRPPLSEAGFKKVGDDKYIVAPKRYEPGWTPDEG